MGSCSSFSFCAVLAALHVKNNGPQFILKASTFPPLHSTAAPQWDAGQTTREERTEVRKSPCFRQQSWWCSVVHA